MSILHPTPGQLIDRAAALIVKSDKFKQSSKPSVHLDLELQEIDLRIPSTSFPKEKKELVELHKKMWELVDIVGVSMDTMHVATAAKNLHALNLTRHRIVAEIDKAAGEFSGDEKL